MIYSGFRQEAAWERGCDSIRDQVSPQSCGSTERRCGLPSGWGRLGWSLLEKQAARGEERNVLRQPGGPAAS